MYVSVISIRIEIVTSFKLLCSSSGEYAINSTTLRLHILLDLVCIYHPRYPTKLLTNFLISINNTLAKNQFIERINPELKKIYDDRENYEEELFEVFVKTQVFRILFYKNFILKAIKNKNSNIVEYSLSPVKGTPSIA